MYSKRVGVSHCWGGGRAHDAIGRVALMNKILHHSSFSHVWVLVSSQDGKKQICCPFGWWKKIKNIYIRQKRGLRQNQTTLGLKPICHDVTNSQTSKLLWSDTIWQKKRGGKAQSLTAHTPCAWRANTVKRLSSLKTTETHTRTHRCCACWQSQHCLCDTHFWPYKLAATGRPNSTSTGSSTGHVYELGGVDGCQHLPSLSYSLSWLVSASCKYQCSDLLVCWKAIVLWFMSVLMKSYCADRDQSCNSIGWWETVMQSESMCKSLIIDGFITDNLSKGKMNYPEIAGLFAWLTLQFLFPLRGLFILADSLRICQMTISLC